MEYLMKFKDECDDVESLLLSCILIHLYVTILVEKESLNYL